MTDRELLALHEEGFVPGPGEDEGAFRARIEDVKKNFQKGGWIPAAHWDWVREYLGRIFDVKPLYICAFYSNRSLAPWQGAATWIEGKRVHSIQLRKGSYWGLYSREEILAHEAVHATRSGFEGDRYEEFFAYMTSEKRWRRVLGPLFQRPWEVWPFLVAVVGGAFWPVCYLGAAGWMGMGFGRLIRHHRRLKRASERIFEAVGEKRKARAILFRLTDPEIDRLAKGASLAEVEQDELRWKVIRLAYLMG